MVPKSQEELLTFVVEQLTAQEEANALLYASLLGFLRDKGALTPLECDTVLQAPHAIHALLRGARQPASEGGQPLDPQSEAVGRILGSSTGMVRLFLDAFDQQKTG